MLATGRIILILRKCKSDRKIIWPYRKIKIKVKINRKRGRRSVCVVGGDGVGRNEGGLVIFLLPLKWCRVISFPNDLPILFSSFSHLKSVLETRCNNKMKSKSFIKRTVNPMYKLFVCWTKSDLLEAGYLILTIYFLDK